MSKPATCANVLSRIMSVLSKIFAISIFLIFCGVNPTPHLLPLSGEGSEEAMVPFGRSQ